MSVLYYYTYPFSTYGKRAARKKGKTAKIFRSKTEATLVSVSQSVSQSVRTIYFGFKLNIVDNPSLIGVFPCIVCAMSKYSFSCWILLSGTHYKTLGFGSIKRTKIFWYFSFLSPEKVSLWNCIRTRTYIKEGRGSKKGVELYVPSIV